MEQYFSDIASTILKFTNFYHKRILNNIVDSNDYIDEPKRFIYTVIRKTKDVLEAISVYIKYFDTYNHYQISIYILLRSILSDIIFTEYVIIIGKEDIDKEKIIKSIYIDHIDKVYKSIDTNGVYAKMKNSSPSEIENIKKDFISMKPEYFDENGKIIGKPSPTLTGIIKTIFSQKPKNKNYKLLETAFHYYDMFSKYEHLGELSFYLVHRVYNSDTTKNRFFEIFQCIDLAFSALINYCNCWDERFKSEIKELMSIQKEFHNMHPNKMSSI